MSTVIKKQKAAQVAIFSNVFLIVSKLIAGFSSGSVSIISDAIHSLSDFLTSVMAFFAIKKASKPADKEHPFGHEKFEDLSAFIEGVIISLAGAFIIKEAYMNIVGAGAKEIHTTVGIVVITLCIVINFFVYRHLQKVGKQTGSTALLADSQHLKTDVITSVGVLLGLVAIKITEIMIIDSIVAFFVALFVIKTGYELCIQALQNLLDASLPKEHRVIIKDIIKTYIPVDIIKIQDIKTRKAGGCKIVQLTLVVPENMTIKQGHILCDKIEDEIEELLGNTKVIIHLEPCDNCCGECSKHCN